MGSRIHTEHKNNKLFYNYHPLRESYDEYFSQSAITHPKFTHVFNSLQDCSIDSLDRQNKRAQSIFKEAGVSFKVNSDPASEGTFPFDVLPRLIMAQEWDKIRRGLLQRVLALNLFLQDIYGSKRIVKEGIIPETLTENCTEYYPFLAGVKPQGTIDIVVEGCDLIRQKDGQFYVLEDNLRTPSGVSYLLENRRMMQRLMPDLMKKYPIEPVSDYPQMLLKALQSLAPNQNKEPFVVVLTPGPYNCAYFEHKYLARQMHCPLVENTELFVENKRLYWKGKQKKPLQVDVVYKRTDDQFIDPTVFRKDSLLGIPGIIDAYLAGQVALANGVGNGIADNKAVYEYVPKIIRFYLDEDHILPQIPTYIAANKKERQYILSHIHELVIKAVNQSGGYGMLIGPQATKKELEQFKEKINTSPSSYIAQPLIELSTMPALDEGHQITPHRVDLRTFIVSGKELASVLPGALTRVALKEGSYVVNSSQGGGSKDTWVQSVTL